MAINVLDIGRYHPGANLGRALGTGLSAGLESLAHAKMQQLEKQNRIKGLESLGFAPQEAQNFSGLDPRLLEMVVQQRLQEPSQQAFAQGLQSILGVGQPPQQISPYIQEPSPQGAQQQMTPEQFNQLQRAVPGLPLGAPPAQKQNLPPQIRQSQPMVPTIPSKLNPQQAMQLAQLGLQQKALSRKEEIQANKIAKQEATKLQLQADKETLPYYNEVLKEDKAAKDIDIKTNRMIELINKGKLPDPVYYKQLKDLEESITPFKAISGGAGAGFTSGATAGGAIGGALGFGVPGGAVGAAIGGVLGAIGGGLGGLYASRHPSGKLGKLREDFPDTEEFEKLSSSFISGAKAIFGSRITDQDLKAFMLTVPQLSNTDAGKKAIIKNIQLMNKAAHVKADTMKKIIQANDGKRPANLPILVDELSGPELDKLAAEFAKG